MQDTPYWVNGIIIFGQQWHIIYERTILFEIGSNFASRQRKL